MNTDMTKMKYEELTGQVLKCAFEVHNALGCGFLEKVYEKALIHELKSCGLNVETQKAMRIEYKGENVGNYIADLVVNDKVIVELKTAACLTMIHKAQTLNYLRASGHEVALLLNFSKPRLEYKRVVR